MSEEEFNRLPLLDKWTHIATTMAYIQEMDGHYDMRRRLNPHHAKEQVKEERRSLRKDQYERWAHLKNLYASNRDELSNTFDNDRFAECRRIIESVFTIEFDDALRDVIE